MECKLREISQHFSKYSPQAHFKNLTWGKKRMWQPHEHKSLFHSINVLRSIGRRDVGCRARLKSPRSMPGDFSTRCARTMSGLGDVAPSSFPALFPGTLIAFADPAKTRLPTGSVRKTRETRLEKSSFLPWKRVPWKSQDVRECLFFILHFLGKSSFFYVKESIQKLLGICGILFRVHRVFILEFSFWN